MRNDSIDCSLELFRLESPRPRSARIRDLPFLIHEIKPFRPRDVSTHHRVVHPIDVCLDPVRHRRFAFFGDGPSFLDRSGIVDVLPLAQMPALDRMCFPDVNHQKRDTLVILVIKLSKADRLANERRSRKAPEYEGDRFPSYHIRQSNPRFTADITQLEVRGGLPHERRIRLVLFLPSVRFSSIFDKSHWACSPDFLRVFVS